MSVNVTWFGCKALFRVEIAESKNEAPDDPTVVEERVILLIANDADEALQRLELLADEYAKQGAWYNADGQEVRTRRLAALDVYRISSELVDGAEVYSRTEIFQASMPDAEIVSRFFGAEPSQEEEAVRVHFEPDFDRMTEKLAAPDKDNE